MIRFTLLHPASYPLILVLSAVLPAVILLVLTWRLDRLDRESPRLLLSLLFLGIRSAVLAIVWEEIGVGILDNTMGRHPTEAYRLLLYFPVVGLGEEFAKFLFLRIRTWKEREFNCTYDGVVYAVFLSLGFALWENLRYVFSYGLSTALVRAVTAVPGHACFGVFMGVFYGRAKYFARHAGPERSRLYQALSLLVPTFLHGLYDYLASDPGSPDWTFTAFLLIFFGVSIWVIRRSSRDDTPI